MGMATQGGITITTIGGFRVFARMRCVPTVGKKDFHESEKNLKAVKNDKLKGTHCKPFYQKERW